MVHLSLVLQTLICCIACSLVMGPCCLESTMVMLSRCVFSKYPSCMWSHCLFILPSSARFQRTPGKWFIYKFSLQSLIPSVIWEGLTIWWFQALILIKDLLVMARWVSQKLWQADQYSLIGDCETVPTAFPKDKTWIDNAHTYTRSHACKCSTKPPATALPQSTG